MQTRITTPTAETHTSLPRSALVQRACACGGTPGIDGECAECRKMRLQRAPLVIGVADDAYEHEARRAADAVMRPDGTVPRLSAVSPSVARSSASDMATGATAPPAVHDVLRMPGQALDGATRTTMERRFGLDFSQVRIHTNAQAANSAGMIGARAYTVGHNIVFGQGQYAPSLDKGQHLLAHELAHVAQQRGAGSGMVQRDLIYGSGYANPFKGNPTAEANASAKGEWFPSSVDFAATAQLSGGGRGIATLKGLLADIGGKPVGSITSLDLIGHANGDLFALGGTIDTKGVSGSKGGTLGDAQLSAVQPEIDKVRDRFAAGAKITIYGCNSGASGVLLQAISTAFKVCARGFKDAITWCLGWTTNPIKIDSRGRTMINPPAGNVNCEAYNASIYSLTTDVEDCSGTKPKVPDVKLPDRKPRVPQVPE